MTGFGVVLVTTGSEAEAQAIARSLVTAQLAACVNYVPVRSVYTWQGDIQDEAEWQLVIKTRLDQVEALIAHVQAIHTYDVPEIIAIPMVAGSPPYLAWLGENVRSRRDEP